MAIRLKARETLIPVGEMAGQYRYVIGTELYNKLTEDRANEMFKRLWFNEIYDRLVRGFR